MPLTSGMLATPNWAAVGKRQRRPKVASRRVHVRSRTTAELTRCSRRSGGRLPQLSGSTQADALGGLSIPQDRWHRTSVLEITRNLSLDSRSLRLDRTTGRGFRHSNRRLSPQNLFPFLIFAPFALAHIATCAWPASRPAQPGKRHESQARRPRSHQSVRKPLPGTAT